MSKAGKTSVSSPEATTKKQRHGELLTAQKYPKEIKKTKRKIIQ